MTTIAEDRDAIRDLLARYCLYIDNGAADEWAAVFTDDAVFNAAGNTVVGTEALRKFAAGVPAGAMHHVVANEVIDVDGDTATAKASIIVLAGGTVTIAGRYEDELRRVEDGWRISNRTFTPDARAE